MQIVERREAEAAPRLLLVALHRSELDPREPHRVGGREAALPREIVRAAREMERELVGHVALDGRAAEDAAPERSETRPERHHASCAPSAVFIASAARCQRSVSARRRRRPAAVRR